MSLAAKYRPDIDGLRAIAVIAVVAFHAAPGRLPGGFIGVDVFFVISGFLITSILLNSLEKDKFSILEFYERRVRRIFPALFVVLFTCAVAGWFFLLHSEYQQLGKHTAAGTAFVSNFALWNESGYFDISAMFKPLLHLWSLGIEEQFYIFWPLILWLAYKKKWSLPLTISALAIASFILNIYLTNTDKSSAFYLPFPRFWELLVGALLACTITARKKFDTPALGNAQSILGLILLAVGFILINEEGVFPGWWALMPVMGSALMISAGSQAIFNRLILSNRLMVWVGLISYPLYLWHWPILSFLRVMEGEEILQYKRAIAVLVSFILAWLTYQFVEKPVRQAPRNRTMVLVLLALLVAVGLFGYSSYKYEGFKNRESSALPKIENAGDIGTEQFFSYIKDKFHPCTPKSIHSKIKPELAGIVRCFQSKTGENRTVALIGDSHAEHLFIGLSESLHNENIVFYPTDGLPVLSNKALEESFKTVFDDKSIHTVVLNAFWVKKADQAQFGGWENDFRTTVSMLTAAGKKVYSTDDVQEFSFIPSRCKFSGRLGIENKCSEKNAHKNLKYLSVFEAIASENQNFHVLYSYNYFCRSEQCDMARNKVLLFRDTHHLNIEGSRKVGKVIASQINAREAKND